MIRINDVHAINIISKLTYVDYVPATNYCIANYDTQDKLTGGGIFNRDTGFSIQVHIAILTPRVSHRAMIWLGFWYAFKILGRRKLFILVPEWNIKSRRLADHFGFCEDAYIPNMFENGGIYVMSMWDYECKWLDMKPPKIEFAPMEKTSIVPPEVENV